MKAISYNKFKGPLELISLPDPQPSPRGVVLKVEATGLCRSDWHGWQGHDPDINVFPHVPGHEMAGEIVAVGKEIKGWTIGDRVTLPFVCGCGTCQTCISGDPQVCERQFQPGFTNWGSFAEFVAIHYADENLVSLPEEMDYSTAASLGCRFATAFRAIVDQGQVAANQWVAIHGCGGVGLSAIMIARAFGAQVIAIDIKDEALKLAQSLGAEFTLNPNREPIVEAIIELSQGGAHLSMDALGSSITCFNSIACLRRRGKHVQVGLMVNEPPRVPMAQVIAKELEILGSHGMPAHRYAALMEMIQSGQLSPQKLITRTITLKDVINELPAMEHYAGQGVTVINMSTL